METFQNRTKVHGKFSKLNKILWKHFKTEQIPWKHFRTEQKSMETFQNRTKIHENISEQNKNPWKHFKKEQKSMKTFNFIWHSTDNFLAIFQGGICNFIACCPPPAQDQNTNLFLKFPGYWKLARRILPQLFSIQFQLFRRYIKVSYWHVRFIYMGEGGTDFLHIHPCISNWFKGTVWQENVEETMCIVMLVFIIIIHQKID